MARVQRTPFVILGLLGLSGRKPRSGYEIKKAVDTVVSHFWSESNGQIYPVLKQLSSEGLIRARAKKDKGREKTLYAITPQGEAALRAWLATAPEIGRPRDELILKLFFGSETEPSVLIGHLQAHRDRAQASLAECARWQKEVEKQPSDYSVFHLITLRAGSALAATNLKWAEESIATLTKLARAGAQRP